MIGLIRNKLIKLFSIRKYICKIFYCFINSSIFSNF
uniref:Uncharacterized protein n=1 Tax=CrAss-like virus sp. ctYsL76 TaxID=2826826 RepID=A0A8S5QLN2_9CAUD|nr:MAG TPA: hypothetical protein [CrAss-like virus sp. ctYsL76]